MSELIAQRAFPAAYIGLDLLFLVLFAGILLWKHRSAGFTLEEKLRPLIVNSLLETNLGFPICSPFILPSPAGSRKSCITARRN